jgi:hypothetical protein
MPTPDCQCAYLVQEAGADPTTLHLIAWMIDDAAHEAGPDCAACGQAVPVVRFRCREHYEVLCPECVAAPSPPQVAPKFA